MPLPFETPNPRARMASETLDPSESYGAKLRRLSKSPHYYEVMQEQGWGGYDDKGRFRIQRNPDDARLEALINDRERRLTQQAELAKQQSSPEYIRAMAEADLLKRKAAMMETPDQQDARARARAEWELSLIPKRRAAERPEDESPEGRMRSLQMQALEAQIAAQKRAAAWADTTGMGGVNEGMTPEMASAEALARRNAGRMVSSGMASADDLKAALANGSITREQYAKAILGSVRRKPMQIDAGVIRAEQAKEGAWFSDPDVAKVVDELAPYISALVDEYGIDETEAVKIVKSRLPPGLASSTTVSAAFDELTAAAMGRKGR